MPNIYEMFPGKYVKSAELKSPAQLTIKEVKLEKVYNPRKGHTDVWVVYFMGAKKGLILNEVNAYTIADILGSPDTEDWIGGEIELYPTTVQVGGETKAAIRVREPQT